MTESEITRKIVAPSKLHEYCKMRYDQAEESFSLHVNELRNLVNEPSDALLVPDWTDTDRSDIQDVVMIAQSVDGYRRRAVWWKQVVGERVEGVVARWVDARRQAMDEILGTDEMSAKFQAARDFVNLSTMEYARWWVDGCPEDEVER